VVELVVARVHDPPARCLQHHRDVVRDRVRHPDEVQRERTDLDRRVRRIDLLELRRVRQAVLVELRLDQPEREPGREHAADLDLAQHVRERADVVLMPVREHDRVHPDVLEVAEVGQHEIDAEVLVPREREPGVDDDRSSVVLVDGHVLADLAEPAERDDPDRIHPLSLRLVGRFGPRPVG
jgi:hypothetical protein